jgi:hypothetical protein
MPPSNTRRYVRDTVWEFVKQIMGALTILTPLFVKVNSDERKPTEFIKFPDFLKGAGEEANMLSMSRVPSAGSHQVKMVGSPDL